MYCPNCEAEYQAGIMECKDCKIALVDRLTPETAVHDHSDADMVLLASFKFSGEAQMLQELLEKNDVRSYVQGATTLLVSAPEPDDPPSGDPAHEQRPRGDGAPAYAAGRHRARRDWFRWASRPHFSAGGFPYV